MIEIGKRIKALRNKSGLTQNKIAKYLSLDQRMIVKIENGKTNITSEVIEKLSFLFGCTIDYILFGKNQEQVHMISFKLSNLTCNELKSLAVINKIVLNQFEMGKILKEHNN